MSKKKQEDKITIEQVLKSRGNISKNSELIEQGRHSLAQI